MKLNRLIDTRDLPREEWLKYRRLGIGGSDASAVVGLNPFIGQYALWADKTGKLPEKPDSEAMRVGRDLEDYIARRWAEANGKKVRRIFAILQNEKYPWAIADVDRVVVGEDAGLEIKSTSVMNMRRYPDGEYPLTYYVQSVHYMAVTQAKKWYIAVFVLGDTQDPFRFFEVERDEDEISNLMAVERDFWREYIIQGNEPPADDRVDTAAALGMVYSRVLPEAVTMYGSEDTARRLMDLKEKRDKLDSEIRLCENTLKAELKSAEVGLMNDGFKVEWKERKAKRIDTKRLREEHPELVEKYLTETATRTFKIKQIEEE